MAKDVERRQVNNDFFDLNYRVEFGAAGRLLLLREEDQDHFVREAYITDLIEEVYQSLVSIPLAYEQKDLDGALAFVLFGQGSYRGRDFYTQQSFLRLPNGSIRPGGLRLAKWRVIRSTQQLSR